MKRIVQEKTDASDSYRGLCLRRELPYSSFMRWQRRHGLGEDLVAARGPDRRPLNVEGLFEAVQKVEHRRHRSFGVASVYGGFQDQLARRQLRALVRCARQEWTRDRAASQRRIEWLVPGVVWAMDDLERRDLGPERVFWHQVQDLGSRYKFEPPAGPQLDGDQVAMRLRELFETYGPPLFLKRDNGGNLNSHAVNDVLDEFIVLPLNSPPRYPPYNGAIEEAQREFQEVLDRRMAEDPSLVSCFPLATEAIGNELNHRPRPCLDGECSCSRFFTGRMDRPKYNRSQRKEVYQQVLAIARTMMATAPDMDLELTQAIWRRAVETWLQDHGMIRIINPSECNPVFSKKWSH